MAGACSCLLCFAVIAFAGAPASAQITEVETFTVGEHSIYAPDVAVGTNGTVVFIWTETEFQSDTQRAVTRRFSAAGIALHAPVEIDATFNVRETAISVRPGLRHDRRLAPP